jgi:hypothetical protein
MRLIERHKAKYDPNHLESYPEEVMTVVEGTVRNVSNSLANNQSLNE